MRNDPTGLFLVAAQLFGGMHFFSFSCYSTNLGARDAYASKNLYSTLSRVQAPLAVSQGGGRGVQSLFGQCPNRGDANFGGASLTTKAKQVHPSKELSSHEKEPSRMGQLAHIIPEPQGHSLSSQAPGGPPPCMNDCIAQPTPGPLAPMGLHGPPVPGNSVESKQARRGASTSGGHFCI